MQNNNYVFSFLKERAHFHSIIQTSSWRRGYIAGQPRLRRLTSSSHLCTLFLRETHRQDDTWQRDQYWVIIWARGASLEKKIIQLAAKSSNSCATPSKYGPNSYNVPYVHPRAKLMYILLQIVRICMKLHPRAKFLYCKCILLSAKRPTNNHYMLKTFRAIANLARVPNLSTSYMPH